RRLLAWLQSHDPLYKDIEINARVLDGQPDETILPFHIQHVVPSGGIDASLSSYIPNGTGPSVSKTDTPGPILSDILNPPTMHPIPFESVMVANVEGHTSPNELRKAVIDHMNLPHTYIVGYTALA
ncbi:hypothetical protein B0H14DRAFT_2398056, partial [Mycena olivaceomarginata]